MSDTVTASDRQMGTDNFFCQRSKMLLFLQPQKLSKYLYAVQFGTVVKNLGLVWGA